jgi:hypothetical protein
MTTYIRLRQFISTPCGTVGDWPLAAPGQQSKAPTIGLGQRRRLRPETPMLHARDLTARAQHTARRSIACTSLTRKPATTCWR